MRVLAVLFALLLTACAGTQESAPMCPAPTDSGTPFGQALQRTALHYGNKVTSEDLALAGLSGLSVLDPTLKIAREPPRIVFQMPGKPVNWVTVPVGWEMSSWREKVVDILGTAKRMSPLIAATPPEKLQAALVAALADAYPTPKVVNVPCPPAETRVAEPNSADHCYGIPYGQGKTRVDRQAGVNPTHSANAHQEHFSPVSQRFVVMDRPLPEPPEIGRIQRGYVETWGGSSNSSATSWNAVDLDRMEMVSVQRRTYERQAQLSQPFGDPELPDWDRTSQVRKWSDDNRTEMEVVARTPLREADAQAFVCVANGAWADRTPQKYAVYPHRPASFVHNTELRDRAENNGQHVGYWKSIHYEDALSSSVHAMFRNFPSYSWPLLPRSAP